MDRRGRYKPIVFLDASCLVAAVLSPTGGSFRLLEESSKKNIRLKTNWYALGEVKEVLRRKYPQNLSRLEQLTLWSQIEIQQDPSAKQVARYLRFIDSEDAPILAGATHVKAEFLVTLDRKDFMTQTLAQVKLPLLIVTPQNFFQNYFHLNIV